MMDQFLAGLYGTNKTAGAQAQPAAPSQEDLDKQAHVNLFIEAATAQGIDLNALPQEKVAQLYSSFTTNIKEASAPSAAPSNNLEAVARAEWEKQASEQQEQLAKIAEYDFAGRVMAHAYVNELSKIAGEMPEAFKAHVREEKREAGEDPHKPGKESDKKEKQKEASAPGFTATASDRVAAEYAMALLDQNNKTAGAQSFDLAVAEQKLAAVLVLGPAASTKTAGVADFDQMKHVRALELLEQAGYPVSWG